MLAQFQNQIARLHTDLEKFYKPVTATTILQKSGVKDSTLKPLTSPTLLDTATLDIGDLAETTFLVESPILVQKAQADLSLTESHTIGTMEGSAEKPQQRTRTKKRKKAIEDDIDAIFAGL